ncbi:RTA1-domain-containing protein [Daedalea quercina L-15889]|uniref:RTA1-domain-containing protein n=1 Tax=Daedalea quercina L-15889 TaxID=1314783 RepID=A0A165Q0Z9_9APHY|nr:RTA1-domain-containing protein [Daedalea quercina L-15889]
MQSQFGDPAKSLVSLDGYTPTAWVGILMVVIFVLTTTLHFFQAIRYSMWFLLWTAVVAGILEVIGWTGRLWSSYQRDVSQAVPFSMQITCLVIGPTPLIAANFVILGHVIRRLGQQYSQLKSRLYTIVFVSCDIIALVVQALGAATAIVAVNNHEDPKNGSDIMLAGVVFQTAAITLYLLFAAVFFLRYFYDRPIRGRENIKTGYVFEGKLCKMAAALIFSSLCFYVRTWYRCIELGNEWNGTIIHTERYFVIMDAVMIAIAMWTLNTFHPARLLGHGGEWHADKNILTLRVQSPDSEAEVSLSTNHSDDGAPKY